MRIVFLCALAGLLSPAPAFAQGVEDELRKLKAEVERLREENGKLNERLKHFSGLVRELQATRDEEGKLEGVWVIEAASRDGKERKPEKGAEIEFRGNRVVVRMPGRNDPIHAEVALAPSAKQINFIRLPGQRSVPTETALDLACGIYEWDGDTLRISLQSAYTIPKEVSDKGQVLWVLKRKKS